MSGSLKGGIVDIDIAPSILNGEELKKYQDAYDSGEYDNGNYYVIGHLLAGVASFRRKAAQSEAAADETRRKSRVLSVKLNAMHGLKSETNKAAEVMRARMYEKNKVLKAKIKELEGG